MIKVLVCDDERLWCQAFCSWVNWADYGYEIVGTAFSGPSALKLFRETLPDILLTDIRMPGFDGIELLKLVKTESPETHVIILSAFSEFEYARKAMRYNADEYLLKTESDFESIISVMNQIRDKIACQKNDENVMDIVEKLQKAAIIYSAGGKYVPDAPFFQIRDNVFLIEGSDKAENSIRKKVETDYVGYAYREENEELETTIKRAEQWSKYAEFFGLEQHMIGPEAPKCRDSMSIFSPKTFLEYLSNGDMYSARLCAENLIQHVLAHHDLMKEDLMETISWMARATLFSGKRKDASEISEALDCVLLCSTAKQMNDLYPQLMNALFMCTSEENEGQGIILDAIQYIQEHLEENPSLSEVARSVHISPTHLSSLFKEKTGIGFSQYLQKKRVEAADCMLLTTDMQIREIALALGFNNESYFTQAYKRIRGISPKHFRKVNQRNK